MEDRHVPEWYEWGHAINQAAHSAGLHIEVEWLTTVYDGFVQVTYYSNKISRAVVLETVDRWGEENLAELDRFVDSMIAIKAEIDQVAAGTWPLADSPLRNAPHTAAMLVGEWNHPYDRKTAVFPGSVGHDTAGAAKYWPPVGRIDNAYGDRNLMCACPPLADLASE